MATGTIKSNRITGQYVTTAYINTGQGWVVFKFPKYHSLTVSYINILGIDGNKTSSFSLVSQSGEDGLYIMSCNDVSLKGYYARIVVLLS